MIKYMLDTNICIYAMKEKPASVYLAFKQHQGMMCISTITLMESAYPAKNIAVVEDFVARLEILTFDDAAASHAAQLRAELSNAGTPFGPSDTMIAGHARSIGVILVSNNTREFTRVTGLRLKDWV
jgi:tRNA(fMet)-specific endonuclease VapC